MKIQFNDIFVDCTSDGTKIPKESYLKSGKYIIIDQGQNQIAGFTNREEGVYSDVPAIIFGDHTRVIKYVDEPFFLGADGVKLLKSTKKDVNYKYLYYALLSLKVLNLGYNRHFKLLKESNIEYCDVNTQNNIVKVLDKINNIIQKHKKVMSFLDTLIKARFVEMFGDPLSNKKRWEKKKLGEKCEIITGNTPSRNNQQYYGDYIEWIKSDNINTSSIFLTKAHEYLSEVGAKIGRIVEKGAVLMTCIAGSLSCIGNVGIADRKVAFNQQINAIIPSNDNPYYLYVLFELTKKELQSSVDMMLKGIVSKSKLESQEYIFPPIELQNQFATFVKQVDKLKLDVQKSLEKTQMLFDSLMQEYFG